MTDAGLAVHAQGLLARFNAAGVLDSADVQVAATLGRLAEEGEDAVLLAVALAVRAVRQGSVCVQVSRLAERAVADTDAPVDVRALPWPDPAAWAAACQDSPLVAAGVDGPADRPVRLVGDLLYLDRYWRQEMLIRRELAERATRRGPEVDEDALVAALHRLFGGEAPDHQRLAAAAAATGWLTVVAGGPGTGKTTTVARLLAVLAAVSPVPPRVALAAPTGKAAARLGAAVAEATAEIVGAGGAGGLGAATLHRLLGWRPDSHSRFRHDRDNRLPYDVVVVDETSMVSLTLMSRLMEALRPDARLILVGDPDQLASVEAGAVLGDLVHRPARPAADGRTRLLSRLLPADLEPAAEVTDELRRDVVRLRRTYRFGGAIDRLAAAIRSGDADAVLAVLRAGEPDVCFEPAGDVAGLRADVTAAGGELIAAAAAGDAATALAAMDRHRLLCAHRHGPYGVGWWSRQVESWVAEAAGIAGSAGAEGPWPVGRPLLVTANDYDVGLFNGDTGVVLAGPVAAFGTAEAPVLVRPARLSAVQTVYAMTVHRSQGSQFERVSVLLPTEDSRLLTRELLYTAVTRARRFVRVIGSEGAVVRAVTSPVVRASGLRAPLPAGGERGVRW